MTMTERANSPFAFKQEPPEYLRILLQMLEILWAARGLGAMYSILRSIVHRECTVIYVRHSVPSRKEPNFLGQIQTYRRAYESNPEHQILEPAHMSLPSTHQLSHRLCRIARMNPKTGHVCDRMILREHSTSDGPLL